MKCNQKFFDQFLQTKEVERLLLYVCTIVCMYVCRYAHGYVRFPAFTKEVDIFSLYVCLYVWMLVKKYVLFMCALTKIGLVLYTNMGVPLYAQSEVHLIIPLVCSNGTTIIPCAFRNLRLILKSFFTSLI
jgi:hypothetical protein